MSTLIQLNHIIRVAIIQLLMLFGIHLSDVSEALAQSSRTDANEILHGRALAKANCSKCHSIGFDGDSPNVNAPAFWRLGERKSIETIALMLINKQSPEHSDMPRFSITALQANNIAKWIHWVQPVARGKRLVEENCSRCHAIGLDDESSFRAAPPFRNLSIYYPIDALEEAFAERIETGHPSMPIFEVTTDQLDDMLTYIATIQKP